MSFQKGDRVKVITDIEDTCSAGATGTIRELGDPSTEEHPVVVKLDNDDEYCFKETELEKIDDES